MSEKCIMDFSKSKVELVTFKNDYKQRNWWRATFYSWCSNLIRHAYKTGPITDPKQCIEMSYDDKTKALMLTLQDHFQEV